MTTMSLTNGSARDVTVKTVTYLGIAIVSAFMLTPLVVMVVTSFKSLPEIFASQTFLPQQWSMDAYRELFVEFGALRSTWNSFYIAAAYTVISLLLCAMGGFAYAKYDFPGRVQSFSFIVMTLAVPFVAIIVPLFVMMRNTFGWIDTPWPLILPAAANAFGIFFMRQYMLSIPDELLEAARVDGASEPRLFFRIVLPLSMPALSSLGIIFFMMRWNDFLWPLAVLQSPRNHTLPVMLNALESSSGETRWDLLMAGSVISIIPTVIVFVLLQRHLVSGITAGAVKH